MADETREIGLTGGAQRLKELADGTLAPTVAMDRLPDTPELDLHGFGAKLDAMIELLTQIRDRLPEPEY